MSCEKALQKGSIGNFLEIEVLENCVSPLNISGATLKEITIKRPDNTSFTRAADFTTDGTDGLISLTSIVTDLTLEGTYYIQAYLELPAWQGNTSIGEFDVEENL